MMRSVIPVLILYMMFSGIFTSHAHANLEHSIPRGNAHVITAPDEIRLFFTEALEPQFSQIQVRNSSGQVMALPLSQVDVSDTHQLYIVSSSLPDDVYTISWKVMSRTDGHVTQGSFPITIGSVSVSDSYPTVAEPSADGIPVFSSFVRWINFISLALWMGSLVFIHSVWNPVVEKQFYPDLWGRIRFVSWCGWLMLGISTLMLLLLQTLIALGDSSGVTIEQVMRLVQGSRFGELWILRSGIWLISGIIFARLAIQRTAVRRLLVSLGFCILLFQSFFSHASGTVDSAPAILADALHLLGMSIWVGGLVQILSLAPKLKHISETDSLFGYFSNLARFAVLLLVITGAYASWLHVGSFRALRTTPYGQALLMKLLLFVPLLATGALNMWFTSTKLRNNIPLWLGRIRYLIAGEVLLAIFILLAVGIMTAITPARLENIDQISQPATPVQNSFFEMVFAEGMMIHLSIEPGTVGENTFFVDLYDENSGEIVDDASLVRLRFQDSENVLGESELRPTYEDGRYKAVGSNISIEGEWQVRMTVQRPDKFDAVVDFAPTLGKPSPTQPQSQSVTTSPDRNSRIIGLATLGAVLLIISIVVGLVHHNSSYQAEMVVVSAVFGMLVLGSSINLFLSSQANTVASSTMKLTKLAVNSSVERPWIITDKGTILMPAENDDWIRVKTEIPARALYLGSNETSWVASDEGFYKVIEDNWEQIASMPVNDVTMTHGYIYALGNSTLPRVGVGGLESDTRLLNLPQLDQTARQFEMLGNHTHVLLNGEAVFQTTSLGLGWEPLNAPEPISSITIDADGDMLAVSDTSVLRWRRNDRNWSIITDLPTDEVVSEILVFENTIYVLANGQVYTWTNDAWETVVIDDVGYINDMAFQYPDTLWLLDSQRSRLLWTELGGVWNSVEVSLNDKP